MNIKLLLPALYCLIIMATLGCKSTSNEEVLPIDPVSPDEIKTLMSFLTSDDLKGRETGSEGISKAAYFIEERFRKSGVQPYFGSYRDQFMIDSLKAFNVVGYVEGNDPELRDEFIIIGAHYDHEGIMDPIENDSIANGANDNASGSITVIMLAEYFAKTRSNKRSMLYVLFTAEELGLLGSGHLAEKLKQQQLDLYTMVNFEMVGVPFVDRDYQVFLSGYELSNMAPKINEYLNTNFVGMSEVSKKHDLFIRSDNYPFYLSFGVPCHSISSCDLTNYDFYHHVDDELEKQDFEHMGKIIEQLKPMFEKMANSETREIKMY